MRNKNLHQIAKKLRKGLTPEERKLWRLFRDRRFSGFKIRRQFPIDFYVVDFCCLERRLIIELDGGQHGENKIIKKDLDKGAYLKAQGCKVLRFWNNDINQNIEGVLETIRREILQ